MLVWYYIFFMPELNKKSHFGLGFFDILSAGSFCRDIFKSTGLFFGLRQENNMMPLTGQIARVITLEYFMLCPFGAVSFLDGSRITLSRPEFLLN